MNINYVLLPLDDIKIFKLTFKKCNQEYENKIIEEYICSICISLVNSPKMCEKCESVFCEVCITKWKLENLTCPNCNLNFKETKIQKTVKNILNKIEIECPNSNLCISQLTVEKLADHIENCQYTKRESECLACHKKIKTTNTKTEIYKHLVRCKMTTSVVCSYCNLTVQRLDLSKHLKKCNIIKVVNLEEIKKNNVKVTKSFEWMGENCILKYIYDNYEKESDEFNPYDYVTGIVINEMKKK
jgi:hypothetical protein